MKRYVKILGTGKYLPKKMVTSAELDKKLELRSGWVYKKTGIKHRHHVDGETASDMAVMAINQALQNANLTIDDIGCIISTSGTYEQAIPCTAALIKEKMGIRDSHSPAFDINSTCLGFVVGLDTLSYLIEAGRYNHVVLVSSDISSVGINYEQHESYVLFGDGAAAVVIGKAAEEDGSRILSSKMETYIEGTHFTEIRGGGTKIHPKHHSRENEKEFLFDMNGKAVFKLSSRVINGFVEGILEEAGVTMKEIDLLIPHQASGMAINIIGKKLGVQEERIMNIIEDHGNVISASIPMALHEAIVKARIKRGSKVLLLGTSAGFSVGGIVLVY
ncbi:MAG: beta-ketoacyl-ACP synthase III [Clostridia bacterium]|nr:beta-ketoacyl-ACP synthase III [Clostridia bacterium]